MLGEGISRAARGRRRRTGAAVCARSPGSSPAGTGAALCCPARLPTSARPPPAAGIRPTPAPSNWAQRRHSGSSSTGVALIALTNGYPIGVPEILYRAPSRPREFGAIQRNYATLFEPFFAGDETPEGSLVSLPSGLDFSRATLANRWFAYAGTYRNDYEGPLVIELSGDALLLTWAPALPAAYSPPIGMPTCSRSRCRTKTLHGDL